MNFCLNVHFADHVLERYAMGKLSNLGAALLEEHVLICKACQNRLVSVEEYVLVLRSALAEFRTPARIGPRSECSLGAEALY